MAGLPCGHESWGFASAHPLLDVLGIDTFNSLRLVTTIFFVRIRDSENVAYGLLYLCEDHCG